VNQREKGEGVDSSLRLHDFQTSEPTSSLYQENISKQRARGNSHRCEKQSDKNCPIGIPEVHDRRARHGDAVKLL
jgi:hypothetical protein